MDLRKLRPSQAVHLCTSWFTGWNFQPLELFEHAPSAAKTFRFLTKVHQSPITKKNLLNKVIPCGNTYLSWKFQEEESSCHCLRTWRGHPFPRNLAVVKCWWWFRKRLLRAWKDHRTEGWEPVKWLGSHGTIRRRGNQVRTQWSWRDRLQGPRRQGITPGST